ncbi:MAG: hypothetical protein RSB11_05955 [Oscillospiraceae bacterium]
MKRKVMGCILIIILLTVFSQNVFAETASTEELDKSIQNEILSEIDSTTNDLLNQIGIDEINYEDLINLSPKSIVKLILNILSGQIAKPFKTISYVLIILIIFAVYSCFINKKDHSQSIQEMLFSMIIIITLTVPISGAINCAMAAINLTTKFMLGYVPAFTGIVAMSGAPATSFVYSGIVLSIAEILEAFCSKYFIGIAFIILSINIISAINTNFDSEKITSLLKKIFVICLSLFATIFVGMLTLKGMLASSADGVAVKGIKLMAGNVLPIIGSAIGDAYTSILGSLSLVKNTFGVFGIFVILLINLPVITELFLWYLILNMTSLFSSIIGVPSSQKIIDNFSSFVSMINILTIFSAFLFIISTGIILMMKG